MKLDTYNVSDWAWTRDRRILFVATPPDKIDIGVIPTHEVHHAIRTDYDLNDLVIQSITLSNGDIAYPEKYSAMASIAESEGKLYVATNETGSSVQNYLSVYDAENNILPAKRIPISGNTKALFVCDGCIYRYDGTTKTLMRFSLDALRLPEPNNHIYPQIVLPGDEIPLLKLIKHADQVVFDVCFDKPDWLSIEDNVLKVSDDADPKLTAYVRGRGINRNGTSDFGACGFYVYVREVQTPVWKAFESLSMYEDQELNMCAFVENADEVQWQHGFTPPSNVELVNGKLKLK